MRGRFGWLTLGAAMIFGVAVMAGEKPPETYVKNMKDTNAAAQSLRKSVEAKDYDAVTKEAALDLLRESEQTQSVRDLRPRPSDSIRELLLRDPEVLQQLLIRRRLFDRVQL